MRILLYLAILAHFVSCSMVSKVAVKTTGDVISRGSDELLTEANWHHFKDSAPANLKMLEGLWWSDQENKELLTLLIKGYGAYSFAVMETLATKDILKDNSKSFYIEQAILNYQKAIYYGEQYLSLLDIKPETFWDKGFPLKLKETFDDEVSSGDYVAIFYFAQALGGSINLQRQNLAKMSKMNHVMKMFEWVCEKDPQIERGACLLFDAVFTASLPSLMGGSQEKAREKFLKLIAAKPYDLLAHVSYIQYHIVPMMEEEEFDAEMQKLKLKLDIWYDLQKGNETPESHVFKTHRNFNLYNSIAKERFQTLSTLRNEIL